MEELLMFLFGYYSAPAWVPLHACCYMPRGYYLHSDLVLHVLHYKADYLGQKHIGHVRTVHL